MATDSRRSATYSRELSRKSIHIAASLAAAGIVAQVPARASRTLLLLAFLAASAIELARLASPAVHRTMDRAFGAMFRGREARSVTGATTLAAGFAIAVLAVSPRFAATGILAAGLGDAAAALAGRHYGRRHTPAGKSLEGSAAAFLTAFLAAWAMPETGAVAALAVAAVTTVLEALPLPFDDNLLLPVAASLTAWASSFLPV